MLHALQQCSSKTTSIFLLSLQESAATGFETCPSWAATGLREVHISGDVAWSCLQVYRVQQQAGNTSWLAEIGYPLLSGIADFWVSRATVHDVTGGLSIDLVIPPDEYADNVNNSAYTNSVAKIALNAAAAAAVILGKPPSVWQPWLDASAALSVPFNASVPGYPGGVHPEYDGYFNTTIKQADVILLGYPLDVRFGNLTAETRRNDLLYYAPLTDPGGPAMTWSMHAIGFLELHEMDKASTFLNQSMQTTLESPFRQWIETTSGGAPQFLTGAGGFLQSLIFGYPGLRINDTALTFSSPALIEGTTSMKLRGLAYLGNRVDVTYDASSITFSLQSPPEGCRLFGLHACQHGRVIVDAAPIEPANLVVVAGGKRYPLVAGESVVLPVGGQMAITASDLPLATAAAEIAGHFGRPFESASWE